MFGKGLSINFSMQAGTLGHCNGAPLNPRPGPLSVDAAGDVDLDARVGRRD